MVALSSDGCGFAMYGTFATIGPIVFSQKLGVIQFSPLPRTWADIAFVIDPTVMYKRRARIGH